MTYAEAKMLRDEIRATGLKCTVPTGHGPDGYFARIWSARKGPIAPVDFHIAEEWRAWKEEADREDLHRKMLSKPRLPLDILIDRACGLE